MNEHIIGKDPYFCIAVRSDKHRVTVEARTRINTESPWREFRTMIITNDEAAELADVLNALNIADGDTP